MSLYLEHFGLNEPPFRITPHTDFFFDGAERGATLEALAYAVLHDEGIVKVSGEVGSGKTMLCRMLMERLPAEAATIYLATPSLARDEILHAIADELDLSFSQERRTVALGVEGADAVQITKGVALGDTLVLDPPAALSSGSLVDVQVARK